MKQVLSPREMATVLGVSESSIKRWVDDGAITSTKTAGGHRRIAVSEAISFIRRQGLTIAEGELIGLPRVSDSYDTTNAAIKESLLNGDQAALERLLVDHLPPAAALLPSVTAGFAKHLLKSASCGITKTTAFSSNTERLIPALAPWQRWEMSCLNQARRATRPGRCA